MNVLVKRDTKNYKTIFTVKGTVDFFFAEKGYDGLGIDVKNMTSNEKKLVEELMEKLGLDTGASYVTKDKSHIPNKEKSMSLMRDRIRDLIIDDRFQGNETFDESLVDLFMKGELEICFDPEIKALKYRSGKW
jgi:hypothetical protein